MTIGRSEFAEEGVVTAGSFQQGANDVRAHEASITADPDLFQEMEESIIERSAELKSGRKMERNTQPYPENGFK